MRLVFAGTPEFAEAALSALIEAGHEVALVLTRPDKAAGRGQHVHASPVKVRAEKAGIPVFQPKTLRDPSAQQVLADTKADAMVVAAYGLILPAAVLPLARLGCLNIHASLLPRWRGAAPIQRAIEAGDSETGITIMQLDEGLDTGAMLLIGRVPIGPDDNAAVIHDRLSACGAELIVQALTDLEAGRLVPVPQPDQGVTYAAKLDKREALLDWRQPARLLADRIRAFDPFPGCIGSLMDLDEPGKAAVSIKIWQAQVVTADDSHSTPGRVIAADDEQVVVACGTGTLRLLTLQKPGARRLPVKSFLQGFKMSVNCQFELPESTL